jgi:hypothetical protein
LDRGGRREEHLRLQGQVKPSLDASFPGGQEELDPLMAGADHDLRPRDDLQHQTGDGLGRRGELGKPGLLDEGMRELGEVLAGDRGPSINPRKVHHDTVGIGQHLNPRLPNHPRRMEEDLDPCPGRLDRGRKQRDLLGRGFHGRRCMEGPRVDPRQDHAPCD